eukprot:TRINITY_DN4031_c0_g1_i2.p1 TRINITY_DN4031_c0_g1~~TRINITY_DN4031_c0_g1_i2.p1  ORF type:complete len:671 (-),score=270.42 TRINITY_DN4031_c0_g1_i2:48-2060(-)
MVVATSDGVVVVPPVELKNIIDKTAEFAAKGGAVFEARVVEKEKDNPKFSFFKTNDIYHFYYKSKIQEFKGGPQISEVIEKQASQIVSQQKAVTAPTAEKVSLGIARLPKPRKVEQIPQPQFILGHPELSALDLDVMKLTAQFVARNGAAFHSGLQNREPRNPQFDFLRQTSPYYTYFTSLIDSYTRILLPTKESIAHLRSEDLRNKDVVLEHALSYAEYESAQERAKRRADQEEEEERMAMQSIDWHDFVVVETIDVFDKEDDLPPPKEIEKPQPAPASTSSPSPPASPEPDVSAAPLPPAPLKILNAPIRRDAPVKKTGMTQMCPKCGQHIPVEDMAEHMRIELLDPKYSAQKRAILERQKESALATSDEISKSLKTFAERRTDIFGQEELGIGRAKDQELQQKKSDKAIWDGHAASAKGAQANALDDQIAAIHANKGSSAKPVDTIPAIGPQVPTTPVNIIPQQHVVMGAAAAGGYRPPGIFPPPVNVRPPGAGLFPPPAFGMYPPQVMMPGQPIPQVVPVVPIVPPTATITPTPSSSSSSSESAHIEEPDAKRQKTEDKVLTPEDDFAETHPGNVTFLVQVPATPVEKTDWKFNGQQLTYTMDIKDTIKSLAEKIKEDTGIPVNKQKLKAPGISILKEQQTLAFYNVTAGLVVTLGVKERGGRKKQ